MKFYTETLGFRVRQRMRIPATPFGPLDLVYLDISGTTLEVMTFLERKSALPARPSELRQAHLKARGIEPCWPMVP